jgi:L-fuconolactonase
VLIVDAQVHIWTGGSASAHHLRGRPDPFTAHDLEIEMAAAGVDCAILAPPGWDPAGAAPSLAAAREQPDRFTVTGDIDWLGPPDPQRIERWRDEPGMTGLRLNFNSPDKQAHIAAGTLDWVWEAAQRVDLPIMLLIPGGVAQVAALAERYPDLRLCVDHLAIPRGAKDAAAFEHLPEFLALARHRNISTKAGGAPTYSTIDAYPYPSLHEPHRRVFDAFGPERIFWASDLSRMDGPYREVVTLWTEGFPWLSADDKRLIMGEAVCHWLDWAPQPARLAEAAAT